jgi:hypothetical protein
MNTDGVKSYPATRTVTEMTTKRISHRWGVEVGDISDYTVGRQGGRAWIRGKGVDLSGPVELLREIATAINEVCDAEEGT